MKLSLSRDFALRQSEAQSFLQDLRNGCTYHLQDDQAEFVRLLDGTKTLEEMKIEYDDDSQEVIKHFSEHIQTLGAIATEGVRSFAEPVPDCRLEAVHFEPSGVCNMRCVHCYKGTHVKNKNALPMSMVVNLLEQMVKLQVSRISVSGGEPLMFPHLESLLKEIGERGIYISALFSNGLAISSQFVETLKSLRYKTPLYISLDSLPGESLLFRGFNKKTAENVLRKIVENIRLVVRAGFRVTVNTVVNTENVNILEKMHDLMGDIWVFNWRLGFPKMTPNFREHPQFAVEWILIAKR